MKTKSLDTPTIDEILKKAWEHGYYSSNHPSDPNMTWFSDDKQALLQWHNSKVLDVIGDEKSFERMFDGKAIVFEKDGTQYPAIPLYTAVMTLKRYRRAIDQTLKSIEESK